MKWYLLGVALACHMVGQTMEIQGHRGARAALPENSLPAFQSAVDLGVDVLELDLQLTDDGVVIIHHDYFLNHQLCSYLDGKPIEPGVLVHSLTLAQIKTVDCGRYPNREFPSQQPVSGTPIPTLQELFEMLERSSSVYANSVRLNLELKRDPRHAQWSADPDLLATKVVALVKQYGLSDRVYYSSFDPESLGAIRKIDPQATLGLIFNEQSLQEAAKLSPKGAKEVLMQIARALGVDVLSPEHCLLMNAQDVKAYQEAGFRVVTWTVNDPERWEELYQSGIDGVITDVPSELKEFLKKKG